MMMTPALADASTGVRRRDLLAYGAGLALVPARAWARRERRAPLAVGYGGGGPDLGAEAVPVDLAPAQSLASGEARLAAGVRVTVHGLTGAGDGLTRLGIRSAELRVGFPVDGAPDVEYRAWSFSALPVENAGSAVAFPVPAGRGLALALELETLGFERFETVLSTGREPGQPKLRAGRYLIAPGASRFTALRFDPAGGEPFIALSVEPLDA